MVTTDYSADRDGKQDFWPRYEDCVHFVARNLPREKLTAHGSRVLEVGSFHPLGGYRSLVNLCSGSTEYVGVDIRDGPGVDIVCQGEDIFELFGPDSFDVVIATELLEHVRDWRTIISNLKRVCKPLGTIIVTTRSKGYGYHAAPFDFWRYEAADIERIFSDCELISIEQDSSAPGIFATVRKSVSFTENDLSDLRLYSIVTGRRSADINQEDFRGFYFASRYIKSKIQHFGQWVFSFGRKDVGAKLFKQIREIAELARSAGSQKRS